MPQLLQASELVSQGVICSTYSWQTCLSKYKLMQETKNIIKSMSIHMLHIPEQGCLITSIWKYRFLYWINFLSLPKQFTANCIVSKNIKLLSHSGVGWVLCLGPYKAEVRMSTCLCSFPEILRKNLLPTSFRLWEDTSSLQLCEWSPRFHSCC